jgi:hypothetical protein
VKGGKAMRGARAVCRCVRAEQKTIGPKTTQSVATTLESATECVDG